MTESAETVDSGLLQPDLDMKSAEIPTARPSAKARNSRRMALLQTRKTALLQLSVRNRTGAGPGTSPFDSASVRNTSVDLERQS